ncbi:retrotransposon protein, putative, ty1-copia subclass [Tanacetum coccineum]
MQSTQDEGVLEDKSEYTDDHNEEVEVSEDESKSSDNEKESTIPNYLRASTRSCHDICKYGKRHEHVSEETPRVNSAILPSMELVNPLVCNESEPFSWDDIREEESFITYTVNERCELIPDEELPENSTIMPTVIESFLAFSDKEVSEESLIALSVSESTQDEGVLEDESEYTMKGSTDVVTPIFLASPTDSEYLRSGMRKRSKLALQVLQGFRIERKLKRGALYLYVGNGVHKQVEAIGSYDLHLPNGLNNVLYFNAIALNGIYEIDMHDLVPNINSIYNVSNKRVKCDLDSTYLWHNHLAHIDKKHIKQLQQDGLLKSTDDESFDKCESCLSGKKTNKPFPYSNERAKDLLGIIHTDICGPLRYVSRQGASYFITFTDDYSRHGYVYLLKHKHELTPPYTPQHNGVSERRNHTLLDMVRSMMNLTTLPLSFWAYALESATHILNMVPTKKVWGCEALVKRDTPDKLEQRPVKCIFIGYPKETMGYYFYFPPENKIIVARYAEFFEKCLISQEISERAEDLEEIQEKEDITPSEITSNIPQEVEGFEPPQPPQDKVIPIRRSKRTRQAPNRLCLNVEVEEHSLGDLNEPTSYKSAILDSESNK